MSNYEVIRTNELMHRSHKYTERKWVNGKYVYTYPDDKKSDTYSVGDIFKLGLQETGKDIKRAANKVKESVNKGSKQAADSYNSGKREASRYKDNAEYSIKSKVYDVENDLRTKYDKNYTTDKKIKNRVSKYENDVKKKLNSIKNGTLDNIAEDWVKKGKSLFGK